VSEIAGGGTYEVYDANTGVSLHTGTYGEALEWMTAHEWDYEYASVRMRIRSVT
jgi:hypothetical protein